MTKFERAETAFYAGATEAEVNPHLDALRQLPRSSGLLRPNEIAFCREQNLPLAFDPMQIGWVLAECADDFALSHAFQRSTAQVTLRDWTDDDAEVYARALSDAALWTYMPDPFPGPIDLASAHALIALANSAAHHHVQAIEADGAAVGQVRAEFSDGAGSAEVSYWIAPEAWGKGYASSGVRQYCEALRARGLSQLTAKVHNGNPASQGVLLKAGFAPTGVDTLRPDWRWFARSL
ncbi:GNAT family N-acetyltransferase [Pseudaestuariivita sp.]|uniref:GNAT family N-acetyltransferase n=1 Tax=Pseudaestuariivita sp. TaxID=2211669 RepID=UPI0040584164